MSERRQLGPWLIGAVPVAATAAVIALEALAPEAYRAMVQEDGPVEWATVAACLLGAVAYGMAARASRKQGVRFPWMAIGLALFCVFFAGEELSWGQRALAYRPPEFFLEHNFQQELNFHNLFREELRTKYLLMLLVGGWGVALPLVTISKRVAERLRRWSFVVPPVAFLPGFAAMLALLVVYPFVNTGEVAECLFALALYGTAALFAVPDRPARAAGWAAGGIALALAIGAVLPPLTEAVAGGDEARVRVAAAEVIRLGDDFRAEVGRTASLPSDCGYHQRIYTWVVEGELEAFVHGSFAEGEPVDPHYDAEARRRYFLDPWNNPYWMKHVCEVGRERVLFYSFGPNRRRDSSGARIAGDDIGDVLTRTGER